MQLSWNVARPSPSGSSVQGLDDWSVGDLRAVVLRLARRRCRTRRRPGPGRRRRRARRRPCRAGCRCGRSGSCPRRRGHRRRPRRRARGAPRRSRSRRRATGGSPARAPAPSCPPRRCPRRRGAPRPRGRGTRAARQSQRPPPQPDGEGGAAAGHRDPLAVALDRQVDARAAEEARGGDEPALARGGGHRDPPRAREALERGGAGPHDRGDRVRAGLARVGRWGDGAAGDVLAVAGDVVERVGLHPILPLPARHALGQPVRAAHAVGARAAVERIRALAAVERVGARGAAQLVVAVAALDRVVRRAGGERVGAGPAEQGHRDRQRHGGGVLALAEVHAHPRDARAPAEDLDDVGVGVARDLARAARPGSLPPSTLGSRSSKSPPDTFAVSLFSDVASAEMYASSEPLTRTSECADAAAGASASASRAMPSAFMAGTAPSTPRPRPPSPSRCRRRGPAGAPRRPSP